MKKEIFPLIVHLWYEFPNFRLDIRHINQKLGIDFTEVTFKSSYLCHQYPELYYKLMNDLFKHPYFIIMSLYIRPEKMVLHELREYNSIKSYKTIDLSVCIMPRTRETMLHSFRLGLLQDILSKAPRWEKSKKIFLAKLSQSINEFYDIKSNQKLIKKAFWIYSSGIQKESEEYGKICAELNLLFVEHQKKWLKDFK